MITTKIKLDKNVITGMITTEIKLDENVITGMG